MESQLFDQWPEKYTAWFKTPIGELVRFYERQLMLDLLQPCADELIADIGCGSGIFTADILEYRAQVVGLDLSLPMLTTAEHCLEPWSFAAVAGDMRALPFADASFDKVVSITALEFIKDGQQAMDELLRITRPGGTLVVATLNSLSPWAERRTKTAAKKADSLFKQAYFRSPEELQSLAGLPGVVHTAIHFAKDAEVAKARQLEQEGQQQQLMTGAFVIGRWSKPGPTFLSP